MKKKIYYVILPVVALAIFISGCANVDVSINNDVDEAEADVNYQYKVVKIDAKHPDWTDEYENTFNQMASEGWEYYEWIDSTGVAVFRKK